MRKNLNEYAMGKLDVSRECFGKNVKPTIIRASIWNEEEEEEKKKRRRQDESKNGSFGTPRLSPEICWGGDATAKK